MRSAAEVHSLSERAVRYLRRQPVRGGSARRGSLRCGCCRGRGSSPAPPVQPTSLSLGDPSGSVICVTTTSHPHLLYLGAAAIFAGGFATSEFLRSHRDVPTSIAPAPVAAVAPAPYKPPPTSIVYPALPAEPVIDPLVPQAFAAGTAWISQRADRLVPFEIVTSAGDNYYVKLVDPFSGRDYARFRVVGGRAFTTKVSPGQYVMRYASGQTWYGSPAFFGPETSFMEANVTLLFEIDGQELKGMTVQLIKQPGGNMKTQSISKASF
jgi:hypothetical protein